MVTGGNTSSNYGGDAIDTILDAAVLRREHQNVASNTFDNVKLPANQGFAWTEDVVEQMTAQDITETDLLENFQQEVHTARVSIVPTMVGISHFVTDRAMEKVNKVSLGFTGMLLQNALERLKDDDCIAIYDTSTNSQPGAASTLTHGHIAAATAENALGRPGSSGTEPWSGTQVAVLQARQIYDLFAEQTAGIGTYPVPSGMSERTFLKGFRGTINGTPILEDNNIASDSANDSKGNCYANGKGGAFVLVQGMSPKTKSRYNPARGGGGMEVYHYDEYKPGVRQDLWSTEIYSDTSAITS